MLMSYNRAYTFRQYQTSKMGVEIWVCTLVRMFNLLT